MEGRGDVDIKTMDAIVFLTKSESLFFLVAILPLFRSVHLSFYYAILLWQSRIIS